MVSLKYHQSNESQIEHTKYILLLFDTFFIRDYISVYGLSTRIPHQGDLLQNAYGESCIRFLESSLETYIS